jgi:AraC-like DNA-binding protein
VRFQHERPHDVRAHERLFGCPVHFGAAENSVATPLAHLELPLVRASSRDREVLARAANELLHIVSPPSVRKRVTEMLAQRFEGGRCDAAHMAAALGTSERALRRDLQHEGTSFRDLLDEHRRAYALKHLQRGGALSEIAYATGFASTQAFHRAFKRWTGHTVSQHRKTGANG